MFALDVRGGPVTEAEKGSDGERGRFVSISVKLAGTTVTVVALVATCIYFALSHYERNNLLASKEAAASMVVRLYVATAVAPLTFGDEKGVEDVVALLAANGDIVHASAWSVSDKRDHLGARLGQLLRGDPVEPPSQIPTTLQLRRTTNALVVDAPVMDPTGKLVGVVQAAFSLAHEREALASTERRTLGISITTSILLTGILLLLARRLIVHPLARLVRAANALERGNRTLIEVTANDEIGKLTAAFVSMSNAIQQRERRIAERNRDLRRVLDNVEDGFLAVNPAGVMSAERSRILEDWFGAPQPEATLFDYVEQMGGKKIGDWLRFGWEFVVDGMMPIEVAVDQLPSKFERRSRHYSVSYRPLQEGEALKGMIVVIRDVSERVELERAEEMQRQMMVVFTHVISDRAAFDDFFKDATRLIESIEQGDSLDDATLRRQVHTLKGNAASFGLDRIAACCHKMESRMVEDSERPTAEAVVTLRTIWDTVATTYSKFSDDNKAPKVMISEDEQEELVRAVSAGADVRQIVAMVTSWRYERATERMHSIGDQVVAVARRLGKGDVEIEVTPTPLRLPPQRWAPFWSVFGHVVRNAVDHGLEGPERRAELGKPAKGVVRMAFEERADEVVFLFGDDGAGVDWKRLAAKATAQGLPAGTRNDLEAALFADTVSTRDEASMTSGRGVGMGAVLSCVTAQGGSIEIESAPGEGTTWVFRFPKTMLIPEEVVVPQALVLPQPAPPLA